jgi:DNA-binding transcriptional LysR family regulator
MASPKAKQPFVSAPSFAALQSAIAVSDFGGITAAAKQLRLTPAAVSKHVTAIEMALSTRLFNRTTRKLSPTEEGKTYIAQARIAVGILADAADAASQKQSPHGTVRVNCAVGFGRRFVLPVLPAFFAQYPKVQVDLVLNDQVVDLVGQGFDIGIRGGSQPPEGMVARKICDIPSVLVASPKYLKRRGTPQMPDDLVNHDLLRVKFLNGKMLPWTFRTAAARQNSRRPDRAARSSATISLDLHAQLLISDPEMILDAVLLDMGIARMGRHHVHYLLERGQVIEVLPDLQLRDEATVTLFYPHRVGLAPRVKALVEFLLARFAEEPALRRAV